ncbi:MAG TPA: alkaline phosphatase D family protein [Hyphomicrobiales bacterium]|nr:alkaline phosphatase D family protein [Hyphomicrobiales bacterium]
MKLQRRRLLNLGLGAALLPGPGSAQDQDGTARLVNGPMLGAPSPDALNVWVQGSEALEATLEVQRFAATDAPVHSAPLRLAAGDDYCGVLRVAGLEPDTEYFYRVLIDGAPDPYLDTVRPLVRTAPRPGETCAFTLALGSCACLAMDAQQPIWHAVLGLRPDLFLWLGDNIYGDSLLPDTLNHEYRHQRAVPAFQPLGRSVPQFSIWDDHDYGLNDHDASNPIKEDALRLFKRYWANPSYGLDDVPGVFYKQAYGAVDIFCLDCRYWRAPNKQPSTPTKTLLGQRQLAWLQQELKASTAVFKLLACGSGWSMARGEGGDSWASFRHERDALFDFIRDEGITGVVLTSGDTHMGELNVIPWSARGGYDFYDLVTSPLAQPPSTDWEARQPEQRIRRPHTTSNNFGWLRFEFEPEPRLVFSVVDPAGRFCWEPFTLSASQLRNGQESWRALADPRLL